MKHIENKNITNKNAPRQILGKLDRCFVQRLQYIGHIDNYYDILDKLSNDFNILYKLSNAYNLSNDYDIGIELNCK